MKHFSKVFKKENGRIHRKKEVIEGKQFETTLFEKEIESGEVLFVEFLGPDQNWPSD